MIAPLDAATLARPVRAGDVRRAARVEPAAPARALHEVALLYSNGVDTVEISRAALAAHAAFTAYAAARGYGPDGLPVRLAVRGEVPGTRLRA